MLKFTEFVKKLNISKKLSDEVLSELIQLDKEFDEVNDLRKAMLVKELLNKDEEKIKFLNAVKENKRYNPIFKHNEEPYTKDNTKVKVELLLTKFRKFDCYLSKYYIEILENFSEYIDSKLINPDSQEFIDAKIKLFNYHGGLPAPELVATAKDLIRKNPHQHVDKSKRIISAIELAPKIQKAIDDLGYNKWKIDFKENIQPRMCIENKYVVDINKTASFTKTDVIGLIEHEIKGHVGRRYYGDKTGLSLFLIGLSGKNAMDEGLAICNSLDVKEPKPNILFNISIFVVLLDKSLEYDFWDLFHYGKQFMSDESALFGKLCRIKSLCHDSSILIGNMQEADYLKGYLTVSKMNAKERDDILKYNIGEEHLGFELELIKEFLKVNFNYDPK